ncbi:hypothetical protein EQZ01_13770 [Bacillus subtilis]|nr:hypothetical protein [Bacillus subtilis]QAT46657.1 hypothetical protein EQZ01_13770 [Bacillus subtilis]QAV84983.1 hypothetical protein ES965_13240 [Bacillus subtilis]RXM12409.1 hypothetical protein ETL41_05185 [Bacillus subtilis]TAH83808.1 hypothetical protein ES060_08565 [Bacillus subtilis]
MASYNTVMPPIPESKNPIFITSHAFCLILFLSYDFISSESNEKEPFYYSNLIWELSIIRIGSKTGEGEIRSKCW